VFYDKFVKLCEQRKVSASRAATEIGLSNSTPTKWKKTKATPDGATLSKIAAYFDVPISVLLESDSENKKSPTPEGMELTETQRAAVDIVMQLSEAQLKKFVKLAEILLEEQSK
jgi:transcriptional regulator with XRE-family HTH domain